MKKISIWLRGAVHALATALYITLVALVITNGQQLFGTKNDIVNATVFLLLFVFSAIITGVLVFGKPILSYIEGNKKEGIALALWTIGFLGIFLLLGLALLLINTLK
jgi:hypothetical protein